MTRADGTTVRVLAGNPTAEELAAVLAVLMMCQAGARPATAVARPAATSRRRRTPMPRSWQLFAGA